jgi:hypothetical protein
MAKRSAVYQLKITLQGIRPPIWRRILVPSNTKLSELHKWIEGVMGWYGGHLHKFEAGGICYGKPSPYDEFDDEDEGRYRLSDIAPSSGSRFYYEYDFGDGWRHLVIVEKVQPPDPNVEYPICTGGRRRCPPEDCGGVWGYAEMLRALAIPEGERSEEQEEALEWVGEDFDPEEFDAEAATSRMRSGPLLDLDEFGL